MGINDLIPKLPILPYLKGTFFHSKNYETNKQESVAHTQENKQTLEAVSAGPALGLSDKDFKKAFVNMFDELKEIFYEEVMKSSNKQIKAIII